jgi:Tol biopolymer transport system component
MSGGRKWLVSNGGGTTPRWVRNGQELFYRSDKRIIATTVRTVAGFSVTQRTVVFEGNFSEFDVYPDGQRVVVNRPADESREIVVILNWIEDVRRKLQAGR